MLDPRDRLCLIEIVESIRFIRQFLDGYDKDAFLADRRTCDAVTMNVFVVSEAVGRLSDAGREALGAFEWDRVRGLRNRIAHGYASISFERIWHIVTMDVPHLDAAARQALGDDPDLPPP